MTDLIAGFLPYAALFSHVALLLLVVATFSRNGWGGGVFSFLGRYSVHLAFLVSLAAILGSLFYSEVIGFEPCVLCWWQRVFLYPSAVILLVSLIKNDKSVFMYVVPLTLIAGLVALYQSYANFGGISVLSCTGAEGACSKLFVKEFGYVTIPVMSLTVSLYVLFLAWVNKKFRNENSNAR